MSDLDFPDVDYQQKYDALVTQYREELAAIAGWQRPIRAKLDRIQALHEPYSAAGYPGQCCAHCNHISGSYIEWPCPTIEAIGDQ